MDGTRWIRSVEEFGPGLIATVEDPDGNYAQIVEFARTGSER
jgi:hypothetical protein